MFITSQIVKVEGPQDQAITKKCTKIKPRGGQSELAAAGMAKIGYSGALKALAQKFWSI
jgi:hypothetical protein